MGRVEDVLPGARQVYHVCLRLEAVRAWLESYRDTSETDQRTARLAYFSHAKMALDYSGCLVLTVGNIPEHQLDEIFVVGEELWNRRSKQLQCFVHGAGPGKAFVVELLQRLSREKGGKGIDLHAIPMNFP